MFSNYTNTFPVGPGANWKFEFTMPPLPCLSYSNIKILSSNGVSIWNPSLVTSSGNTVTAIFNGSPPFTLNQAELKIDLALNCGLCNGIDSLTAVSVKSFYIPDNTCGCQIGVSCQSIPFNVICPTPCPAGMLFSNFEMKRTSYGLPDNEPGGGNGIPDGAGSLDFTKIKTDIAMFGDTLTTGFIGNVKTNFGHPSWIYCYASSSISNGNLLSFLDASLTIYRSGLLIATCSNFSPTITNSGNTRTFQYNLSVAQLGSCLPGGFTYLDNDSIVFKPRYKVTSNIGNATPLNCYSTNELYLSDIANPSLPANKFQCGTFNGNCSIIGYFFNNFGPDNYSVESCNNVTLSQNYYLSIGPGDNNYAGGNLFPYEYRNWAHIKILTSVVPAGYTFVSARFNNSRTAGTNVIIVSPWITITPVNPNSDTLVFLVEQYFQSYGGTIPLGNDGFAGTLQLVIQPSCKVTPAINQAIENDWTFAGTQNISGTGSYPTFLSVVQDSIIYQAPNLSIQSTLPSIIALTDTISWDVNLSNTSNTSNALNTWLSGPAISGISISQVVDLGTNLPIIPVGSIYQVGTVNANTTRTFRIKATYTSCAVDSIIIFSGWDCMAGYPASIGAYHCTTEKITLKSMPPPLVIASTIINATCSGGNNGSISVTPTGGRGTYTYLWQPGNQTTSSINSQPAGTYTITVTDSKTCQITSTYSITQPSAIVISLTQTNVSCFGGSNGTITASPAGGTAPYTYLWAPGGATTASRSGLTAGTYSVSITDALGCTAVGNTIITQPAVISTGLITTPKKCSYLNDGTASSTPSGGTAPYTYLWAPGGATTSGIINLATGTYTLTVNDSKGCTTVDYAVIGSPPPLTLSITSQTNVSCNGGSNGIVTTAPSGGMGPYTYLWAPGGVTTLNRNNLQAGSYTITVTDHLGCIATKSVVITQPAVIVVYKTSTNVSCNGGSNGTATAGVVGGTAPYTYLWAPGGATTQSSGGLTAGAYTVTVHDSKGCIATAPVMITQPIALVINFTGKTNVSCYGGSNGAVTASPSGGTPGYTYLWASGGAVTAGRSGLSVGTYTVTVRDTNSCITTSSVIITQSGAIALSSTLSPSSICSGTLFSYTPTSDTAGASFAWTRAVIAGISNAASSDSGNPNETLINATASSVNVTYVYTVSANGCTNPIPYNVVVAVNPTPSLSSTLSPPSICSGTNFSYSPSSGTAGASFAWTRALVAGISNAASSGTDNPNETLTNTTASPVNVTYVYTVSANGCTNPATYNVVVAVNPTPSLSSTLSPSAICSGTNFSYFPASGTAGASFAWTRAQIAGISNAASSGAGNPNETLTNTTASAVYVTYVYSVSANGCTNPAVYNVVVAVNPTPSLSSTLSPPSICSGTNFSYTPSSGIAGASFAWTRALIAGISNAASSGIGNPNETLTNTTAATVNVTYVYTVSANGCTNPITYNVVVAVNPTPSLSSTLSPPSICSGTNFSYIPSSGTAGASFAWTRALTAGISNIASSGTDNPNETLTNTTAAPVNVTYVYTVSANGCSNNQNVVIAVNPVPALSSSYSPTGICNGSVFNYIPSSGTAGASFSWTRAAVSGISNVSGSGADDPNETLTDTTSYVVNVTYVYTVSANGCVNPAALSVVAPVTPPPALSSTLSPSAICSGTNFSYTPSSGTASASFAWTRAVIAGISNAASSGTGNPNETLTNTTASAVYVTYVYIVSANGCTNPATYNVVVAVNPAPSLSSSLTPLAICSGTVFNYAPVSTVASSAFVWTRAVVTGISNVASSGADDPNETLTDTTAASVNVTYNYTVTANGCSNNQNVVIAVNPIPALSSSFTPTGICSGSVFNYIGLYT